MIEAPRRTWLDRAVGFISPRAELQRLRARIATDMMRRSYDGAAVGRRTQGWRRHSGDANAATGPFVGRLRDVARDLVRNNPYAESALATIVDHTVGWGIVAKAIKNPQAQGVWDEWANSTNCDADGRNDYAGLQKLALRTVGEAGEALVRRRFRRPGDNLPIPLQLQVLEPDYLDTLKHGITTHGGGRIVYGVEFDAIGRRVAYWLFREHPGNSDFPTTQSERVPASSIQHMFKPGRPGAARGASWFAPVLLRFKDFDEYDDATLMKQKVAACLAVLTSDVDGSAPALGTANDSTTPGIDSLEPGMILNVPPGRSVTVVDPPTVREHADYCAITLRSIAAGLGVTYEDLTGDYTDLPFSAARMSRLRHWARVDDWRWRLMIPQFCGPTWQWAMEAAVIAGRVSEIPEVRWTAPPMPMIEPDKEGLAIQRNARSGIQTLSDALRERGYDPTEVFDEMASDCEELDRRGLILDSDARHTTQGGQLQGAAAAKFEPKPQPASGNA